MEDLSDNLQQMKFRLQTAEGTEVFKTKGAEQSGAFFKCVPYVYRVMGIAAEGENLSAHFFVKGEDLRVRVCEIHATVEGTGIQFDPLAVLYNGMKDGFKNLQIVMYIEVVRFCGSVSQDVVQMAVDIVVRKMCYIIKDIFKVFSISPRFTPFFKILRIVRIETVYNMGGADDKVKTGISPGKIR